MPAFSPPVSPLVVALDGPSGSGKSTVSRRVAKALDLRYLDTGAMYRAATWAVLEAGVDPADPLEVERVVSGIDLRVSTDPSAPSVSVDGTRVDSAIRGSAVTTAVSAVSAVPAVRALLTAQQRELAGEGGIVVEGRDIGIAVLPDADVKIFLTASEEARARRRHGQGGRRGPRPAQDRVEAALAGVRADLARRDALDSSRAASPLTQAEDAVPLDTTALTLDEAVQAVLDLARTRTSG